MVTSNSREFDENTIEGGASSLEKSRESHDTHSGCETLSPQGTNESYSEGIMNSTPGSSMSHTCSSSEQQPYNFKRLNDVYTNTEQIELEDDELYLIGVDEPINYS